MYLLSFVYNYTEYWFICWHGGNYLYGHISAMSHYVLRLRYYKIHVNNGYINLYCLYSQPLTAYMKLT